MKEESWLLATLIYKSIAQFHSMLLQIIKATVQARSPVLILTLFGYWQNL